MMDNSINRERCDDHPQSLFQNGCGFSPMITITITPTTGGQFNLEMVKNDTIENLKKIVSKKLKVSRERICLLYRERYYLRLIYIIQFRIIFNDVHLIYRIAGNCNETKDSQIYTPI